VIWTRIFLATCLLAVGVSTAAGEWPQWRGPQRDARSTETGLLQQWPDGGPSLLWRSAGLGAGYSSLAVTGGRIFTMGDIGEDQFLIAASDEDGSILCDLLCARVKTGEVVWRRSLAKDFSGKMMFAGDRYDWRFSESPLVDGKRLIVTPGIRGAALVALNKATGEEIWRAAIPDLGKSGLDGAGYASAVVSEAAGIRQYVQLLGRGLVGIEAETGRFLWGYNRIANHVANIPTPIVSGEFVFASSGYGAGAVLLKLEKQGEGVRAREVYFLGADTMQNHHGGMVLHDGHVYSGTGLNKGFPLCVELGSGKVRWGPVRNAGRASAAPIYADARLYLRYQSGLMLLIEATPEAYREKGSFMIPDVKKESWSHPVIVNGRLYLREQDHLLVYDIAAPEVTDPPTQ